MLLSKLDRWFYFITFLLGIFILEGFLLQNIIFPLLNTANSLQNFIALILILCNIILLYIIIKFVYNNIVKKNSK